MAENADNTSPSPAREARRAPSKRRASSLSPDNESSLMRAAQRVAQPGEPRRDASTLDLFAGDPSYAPVQTVETDRRQGVSGSEQREAEAAQVAATTDSAPADVAVSRDTVHAECEAVVADATPEFVAMTSASSEFAAEAVVAVAAGGNGGVGLGSLEPDQVVSAQADSAQAEPVRPKPAQADPAQAEPAQAEPAQADSAQADSAQAEPVRAEPAAPEPMLPGQALAQLRETRAAGVPRPAKGGRSASRAVKADSAAAGGWPGGGPDQPSEPESPPRAEASSASGSPVSQTRYAEDFALGAVVTESADVDDRPASPEPSRTQSAPYADTVDALHHVIADQRRALTDLSRRMKWMLGAAVGALLVTVAAGVAQTIVLARLATDASAQQQRIAQMLQDQQASLAAMQARLLQPAGQPASPGIDRPVASSPTRRVQHAKRPHGRRSTAQ